MPSLDRLIVRAGRGRKKTWQEMLAAVAQINAMAGGKIVKKG